MNLYECERYVCTKETLKDTLESYGIAIIPRVLNETECDNLVNGLWSFFQHISQSWQKPIQRDDETTWREILKLLPHRSMVYQHWQTGQNQTVWDIRQNPKIVDICAHFYNCEPTDLLVSFDGISFLLPPEVTRCGWTDAKQANANYHTDQCSKRNKNSQETLQSWVTGLDVDEGDGTLAFLEGSHRHYKDCGKAFSHIREDQWYDKTKKDRVMQFYASRGCEEKRIKCPRGSLVLWDSRTVHCGLGALKGRFLPKLRAVVYLCYMPRVHCSDRDMAKKRKYMDDLRMTRHLPHIINVFAKVPKTYGKEIPLLTYPEPPVLSALGKRLAGFD